MTLDSSDRPKEGEAAKSSLKNIVLTNRRKVECAAIIVLCLFQVSVLVFLAFGVPDTLLSS